jgi:hypothetical protein
MAKTTSDGLFTNPHPTNGELLGLTGLLKSEKGTDRRLPAFLLSWICSGVVHGVLLVLFLLVTINTGNTSVMEREDIQTRVDDEGPRPENLTNDAIGDDPNKQFEFKNDRIGPASVPGPSLPDEPVGMKNAPEAEPVNVPPPAGFGNREGQGGTANPLKTGPASPFGEPGALKGLAIPGGFSGRTGSARSKLVSEGGGNAESEACVAAGLKWLVAHQAPDGHWSLEGYHQHGHCNCKGFGDPNDIAGTAFGLLPLLGAGETHKDPQAVYRQNVDRALKYLVSRQARDGNFGGLMYAHGLATIAICEAYGMTSDPALRGPAQRAINFIRAAQHEGGGWRYNPRDAGDTSVTGWQIMALKSGQMAGLEVDDARNPTLKKAVNFLNSCMTVDQTGYGYQSPQEVSPSMTAVGLLCRLYLGTGPRNVGIQGGVQRLQQSPPAPANRNIYYDYCATQVLHHVGGEAWESWNPRIRNLLVQTQDKGTDRKHPHQKGSWAPDRDLWGSRGGRMMTTSLSILTLEVYYRHLPLYRRDMAAKNVSGEL